MARLVVTAAFLLASCGAGDMDETDAPDTIAIEVGPFELAAGSESDDTCFSSSLENDETIYVTRVEMNASLGFHHSNWFFVPESTYDGPDGIWDCGSRRFETARTAVQGGVLFTQSTQARSEVQEFEPGAAIPIPPRSKIVSQLHMLNASSEPLMAQTELLITEVAESDVEKKLAPMYLQYEPLTIPPRQDSRFVADCDIDRAYRNVANRALDVDIHYLLPHYHGLGTGIALDLIGGERDGENIFTTNQRIGEPLGRRLDPPVSLTGVTGLRFGCEFSNPTDNEVGWGIGDQEMCIIFGFTESDLLIGGGVVEAEMSEYIGDIDGVAEYRGECGVLIFPLNQ